MDNEHQFVDFYAVLQVHPECDARTLEVAYRHLAKMYHPDHPETADMDRFNRIIEAYRTLRNAERRLNYDVQYALNTGFAFSAARAGRSDDVAALTDANIHARMLMQLYKKRRVAPRDPGVGEFDLMISLNMSDETLDFHIWYLRQKGFIERTDNGTLAITVEGVDHVIAMSQTRAEQRLQITQADDGDSGDWTEPDVAAGQA
jgi:curved DNA-binding protein